MEIRSFDYGKNSSRAVVLSILSVEMPTAVRSAELTSVTR